MKKYHLIPALLFISLAAFAQTWKNDKQHSRLGFTVTHLMINDITGTFNKFEVTITSSKADFSDAVFELTTEAKSIDTKLEQRDEDLRSPDFFDAEKYPLIQFKSTEIKKIVKNKYQLKGNLSMHGVKKEITADFIFKGTRTDPVTKKLTAGIQVIAILKRADFNIGWKMPFEDLKNDVLITADGEFQQP